MSDRDKVISRLQIIRTWAEVGKNYNGIQGEDCLRDVVNWIDDALVLLKEQEPRVLTLDEVLSSPDTMIWVDEIWNDENSAEQYALIENFTYENCYVILRFFDGSSSEESTHYYNEKWRCWSARPTDEQREAVPWTE